MSIIPLTLTVQLEGSDLTVTAPQQFVGTKGHSRRLEAFNIYSPNIAGVEVEYMAHVEGTGDTHWHRNGQFVGARRGTRRVEGFAVRLIGHNAGYYDVKYYAHIQHGGDSAIAANGDFVGTRGQARRIEGMAVWLESRATPVSVPLAYTPMPAYIPPTPAPVVQAPVPYTPTPVYPPAPTYTHPTPAYPPPAPVYTHPTPAYPPPAPTYTHPTPAYPPPAPAVAYTPAYTPTVAYAPAPAYTPTVAYQTVTTSVYPAPPPQIQLTALFQGSGPITVFGQSYAGNKKHPLKLEGISMTVSFPGLDIEYMAHVENRGDTHWHRNGQQIGRNGGGRIEGFAVRLTGPAARQFDVKYYARIEGLGETGVSSNGAFVGTRGRQMRCLGLSVWLESKKCC